MKGKFVRNYTSQKGNKTFVFEVSGSESEIEAYEEAQGDYLRSTEEGVPLWFTTRFPGKSVELIITTKGNIIADMSEYDQAASMAEQYGGNFGKELATLSAKKILNISDSDDAPVSTSAPAAKEEVDSKDEPENLDNM